MRPIERKNRPLDNEGQEIQFREYAEARGELIKRLGEYCSYCEMHADSFLTLEHIQPKQPHGATAVDQHRALDWNNFLLSCVNCNSTKGDTDVVLDHYFWPDRDNTFRALKYSEGGLVTPALAGDLKTKAENTIKLTGLDKQPLNDPKDSDRRWKNRREAWDIAKRSWGHLQSCNNSFMREQIVLTATGFGYWSIWMTVFQGDPDMLQRLIEAFPGTSEACFDGTRNFDPVIRPGGQC